MNIVETVNNVTVILHVSSGDIQIPLVKFLPLWERHLIYIEQMTYEEFKIQWVLGAISAVDFFKNSTWTSDSSAELFEVLKKIND